MAPTQPLHILVIEDDAVTAELLCAVLGTRGHHVVHADSGEAALALLPGKTFDIVLTDVQLPGIYGHALAAALRAKSSARLIGMSGSQPADRDIAAFDAFLLKPFSPEQFAGAAAGPSGSTALDPSGRSPKTGSSPLDDAIFARLGKQLPADKLKEIYQLTLSDARTRLDLIGQALSAGDLDTVRREAHAIKGAAGMVGASEIYELAAQTEKAATAGSTADTPFIADFYAACDRLERMLDTRF